MDRINSVGTVTIGGIRQWINKNLLGGIPGTQTNAVYENDMQEELVEGIIVASGQTPTAGVQNQVAKGLGLMYAGALVGTARNAAMTVATAGTTVAFTADELILSMSLGGFSVKIGAFNEPLNLATTGTGGMDNGSAPHSSYVAIYAIYNPTTATAALLAEDATGVVAPEVYGGAHMPAGFTYSAIVSVWPTNSSGQLVPGAQIGRMVYVLGVTVLNTTTQQSSYTSLSIASAVPKNARFCWGYFACDATSSAGTMTIYVASNAAGAGAKILQSNLNAVGGLNGSFENLPLLTAETIYYQATVTSGTSLFSIAITGYEF